MIETRNRDHVPPGGFCRGQGPDCAPSTGPIALNRLLEVMQHGRARRKLIISPKKSPKRPRRYLDALADMRLRAGHYRRSSGENKDLFSRQG